METMFRENIEQELTIVQKCLLDNDYLRNKGTGFSRVEKTSVVLRLNFKGNEIVRMINYRLLAILKKVCPVAKLVSSQ